MRNGVRLPAWLARRGYSAQLKRRLSNAAKPKLSELAQDERTIGPTPQGVSAAAELQQYLIWRMAKAG